MKTAILDGFGNNYATGAIVALISIVMVFLILLLIIYICEAVGSIIEKASKNVPAAALTTAPAVKRSALDLNDEDATVACLIASIEMRNEIKKNVQVVSVRKVN